MTIKAVVFDLDGTLVEFNIDYGKLRAEVIRFLGQLGFPLSVFSMSERISEVLKTVEILMKNNGKDEEEMNEVKKKIFSIVDRYELDAARTTRITSGVIPTLKILKEMSVKTAIFTFSGKKSTEYLLKHLRLKPYFDVVIPREETPLIKPNPSHLKTVLDALGVMPEEVVVVGDSEGDMACAKEIKATAVGIVNKRLSPDKLISAGADYLIYSFTDLIPIIEKLH